MQSKTAEEIQRTAEDSSERNIPIHKKSKVQLSIQLNSALHNILNPS
jgi:hypothetical protein